MILYIFRHGQTDLNLNGYWQGQSFDTDLNEQGQKQAQELSEMIKSKGIEVIYSSPLKRALQTAQIVNEEIDVPIIIDNELIEGNFGFAEGKNKEELKKQMPSIYDAWRNLDEEFMDSKFEGGESKREIQTRILNALKKIAKNKENIVGISTHSAIIRSLLLFFNIKQQNIPNAFLLEVRFENGNFFI